MSMIRLTPFAGMTPKTSGSGATPANTGDSDYVAGKGYGGNGGYGAHGQDGYVVIYY